MAAFAAVQAVRSGVGGSIYHRLHSTACTRDEVGHRYFGMLSAVPRLEMLVGAAMRLMGVPRISIHRHSLIFLIDGCESTAW